MPALGRQCCPCVSCMVGLFDDHTRRKRFWLGRERVRWPICVSNTNAPERVLSSLRWPSTPPRAASGPGRRPSFLTPTPTWLPYPSSARIVSITASGRPFLLSWLQHPGGPRVPLPLASHPGLRFPLLITKPPWGSGANLAQLPPKSMPPQHHPGCFCFWNHLQMAWGARCCPQSLQPRRPG